MYTAINSAMDLGFYAGFSALTCALWWILGRSADRKRLRDGRLAAHASAHDAETDSQKHSHLTVSKALPLIYRRSRDTGALLEREENPDTPRTAEIPVVAAMASSMWRLPRALPLAIGIIALIYCGIVFVAMRIDPVSLVTSKDVVVLAAVFPNPLLKGLIVGGALISMFGINVAASFLTPRVLEAMASDGLVPKIFAKRTESGVPIYSFLLTVTLAIIIPMAFQYDMRGIMIISSISRFVQFVLVPLAVITFYYGKNRGQVIANPKKNFVLDVPLSLLSLGLTVFLLAKFKWAAQFSLQADGKTVPNYYAIVAMFIGYIVLPAGVYFYRSRKKA